MGATINLRFMFRFNPMGDFNFYKVVLVSIMNLYEQVQQDVAGVIDAQWYIRARKTVPPREKVPLRRGGLKLDATFLYADVVGSSWLAKSLHPTVAAKFFRSFLKASTRLIIANEGKVIGIDGDRVLGLFHGESKNDRAVKCGLQINWAVQRVIKKSFVTKYKQIYKRGLSIAHGVGIDTGKVTIVRAGIQGSNDIISIGRAPNMAAKLSEIREGEYRTIVSESVYRRLGDKLRLGGDDSVRIWHRIKWEYLDQETHLFGTKMLWKPGMSEGSQLRKAYT